MTTFEKLEAILACVQIDLGSRGLGRDPHDNLFTATAGDFERACRSIAAAAEASVLIVTGFIIPTVDPPAFETDGPLGTVFLARAFHELGIATLPSSDMGCASALTAGIKAAGIGESSIVGNVTHDDALWGDWIRPPGTSFVPITHAIAIERVGPALNGRCHTMRGRDVTDRMLPTHYLFRRDDGRPLEWESIGIGDGGNEIGMGKIPHETIVKNIPNGDLIHCRVPTDQLIVAGVSNWGAYALAAGVYVLRNQKPPKDLFDPDRERKILKVMVEAGALVDGVTGRQEATVDGLSWDDYVKPLVRMREILES